MSGIAKLFPATWSRLHVLARGLLVPRQIDHSQQCGFKVKSYLKLRCKYCYFVRVDGRLHVECNASPRHQAREPIDIKKLW